MFGLFKRQKRTYDVTPLKPGEAVSGANFLCAGVLLNGDLNLTAIQSEMAAVEKTHPGTLALASFDDLGQAGYTYFHATLTHDLDELDGHDLTNLDPAAYENGEHIGYLSTPSEFRIRDANFRARIHDISFSDLCGKLDWKDANRDITIAEATAAPLSLMEKKAVILAAPVKHHYEKIIAFPNGYFTSDFTPFENYTLAKYFEETHGCSLIAIGASYLVFIIGESCDRSAMANDVLRLYQAQDNASARDVLAKALRDTPYLVLRYTE